MYVCPIYDVCVCLCSCKQVIHFNHQNLCDGSFCNYYYFYYSTRTQDIQEEKEEINATDVDKRIPRLVPERAAHHSRLADWLGGVATARQIWHDQPVSVCALVRTLRLQVSRTRQNQIQVL